MQLYSGIKMLTISAAMMGRTETVHPTLVWDDHCNLLVDTAYPGQHSLICEAIAEAGISAEELTHIILTHQDLDHIGSLPALLECCPGEVDILASAIEKPYIQGEKKLLKLSPTAVEAAVKALPQEIPEDWKLAFKHTLEQPPSASVHTTIADGEELPFCGGLTTISTPGHTPGHISLYHIPSKTLIAGDALAVVEGELSTPDPRYCSDFDLAKQSLESLLCLDIEQVICFHGGLYKGDCHNRIAELAKS